MHMIHLFQKQCFHFPKCLKLAVMYWAEDGAPDDMCTSPNQDVGVLPGAQEVALGVHPGMSVEQVDNI